MFLNKHLISCSVMVQHSKTRPNMTIKLLTGAKIINSNKTNYIPEIKLKDFDTRKSDFVPANNKGTDPPAHSRRLVSAFFIRSLGSTIVQLTQCTI